MYSFYIPWTLHLLATQPSLSWWDFVSLSVWVLAGCSATIGADVQLHRIWVIRMGRVWHLRSIFLKYLFFNRCWNSRAILYLSVKTIIVSTDKWFSYVLVIEETLLIPLYGYGHWNSKKVKWLARSLRLKLRWYDLQAWYTGSHCLSRLYFHKNLKSVAFVLPFALVYWDVLISLHLNKMCQALIKK